VAEAGAEAEAGANAEAGAEAEERPLEADPRSEHEDERSRPHRNDEPSSE
jgi:hypothetical protein